MHLQVHTKDIDKNAAISYSHKIRNKGPGRREKCASVTQQKINTIGYSKEKFWQKAVEDNFLVFLCS